MPALFHDLLLDPHGPYFAELMLLVDELEMERSIARYGYHKDNAFAERSLEERLADATYRARLLALLRARLADEQEEEEEDTTRARLFEEMIRQLQTNA